MKRAVALWMLGNLLCVGIVIAQPDTLWTRSYRMLSNPVCQRLVQTSDGGFALGVQTDNNYNNDWGLIKVDSTGRREWSRIYQSDDTVGTLDDVFEGLALAPDGSYYLAGRWNNNRAQLMHVDSEGREIWSENYEIRDDDFLTDVSMAQDGNPIWAGWTHGEIGSLDAYLVKISSDGDVLWHRAYGGRGTDDFLRVISTSDGGYLAVGSTTSFGGMKAFAVKTDGEGNQEWVRTFNQNWENHVFSAVVESPEGGYLAVGNGEFNDRLRLYWVRLSSDGDRLWSGVLEHENGGGGYLLDVTFAPNGGFLVVGLSNDYEYAAYRLDRNGDTLWRFDFGDYPNNEAIEAVLTLEDGGYLLGGRKGNPPISTDVWLIRTAPDSTMLHDEVVLLDPAFPSQFVLDAPYPNPFNSTTTIRFGLVNGPYAVSVYGLDGRVVARIDPPYPPCNSRGGLQTVDPASRGGLQSVVWNAAGFATGEYLIRIDAGALSATRKVVLVK